MHLTGMHRVAEKRIEHLNASQLKNLVKKGILSRIYAHLLSLDNFAKLLDRKAAKKAA
ncbi:SapC [compost metagenome]